MEEVNIQLVVFDRQFLEYSWNWLQDDEIRQMTSASLLSKEDQLCWFDNLKNRPDYLIWGISANQNPIGVTGLKNVTDTDCEYWGYIGEKEYWGKGIGKRIMDHLELVAKQRKLRSIWLRVNKDNFRAVNLYKKMNYKVEQTTDISFIMRKFI